MAGTDTLTVDAPNVKVAVAAPLVTILRIASTYRYGVVGERVTALTAFKVIVKVLLEAPAAVLEITQPSASAPGRGICVLTLRSALICQARTRMATVPV
jgi:hypothetical protein